MLKSYHILFVEVVSHFHMGVSKNSGTPKLMVKIMENPIKMDDLGGPPLFLETPIYFELFWIFHVLLEETQLDKHIFQWDGTATASPSFSLSSGSISFDWGGSNLHPSPNGTWNMMSDKQNASWVFMGIQWIIFWYTSLSHHQFIFVCGPTIKTWIFRWFDARRAGAKLSMWPLD